MKILVFFIYLFLETFFTISFGSRIGVFYLFLEIIISAVFGLLILLNIRNESYAYLNDVSKLFNLNNFVKSVFCKMLAGIFLIIPGIFSDLLGIIALVVSSFVLNKQSPLENNEEMMEEIIDVEIENTNNLDSKSN